MTKKERWPSGYGVEQSGCMVSPCMGSNPEQGRPPLWSDATSQQVWRPVVTPATQGGQFMTMILADDLGGYKDEAPSPFSMYWSAESVGPDIQPLRQSRALDVQGGKKVMMSGCGQHIE